MNGESKCDLCGSPYGRTAYLAYRHQAISPGVSSVGVSSSGANFRCSCCDPCFRSVANIKLRRYLMVGAMLAWLCVVPIVMGCIGVFLPEKIRTNPILLLGCLAVIAGGFLAFPLLIRTYNRRRMPVVLGKRIDPALRELFGIRSWGLLREVLIYRTLSPGEPAIPIDELLASTRKARSGWEPSAFELSGDRPSWSIAWNDGALYCRGCGGSMGGSDGYCIRPTQAQWNEFWQNISETGVWSWAGSYSNRDGLIVMGGKPWHLSISRGDQKMECHGNANQVEANPDQFDRFFTAVLALVNDSSIVSILLVAFLKSRFNKE